MCSSPRLFCLFKARWHRMISVAKPPSPLSSHLLHLVERLDEAWHSEEHPQA
jgi:hypothetical protein